MHLFQRRLFRLEQFNRISRGINHPDLRTTRTANDVLAEKFHSCGTKPRRFRLDVRHFQQNSIPTTRNGLRPVGQGLTTGALRAA